MRRCHRAVRALVIAWTAAALPLTAGCANCDIGEQARALAPDDAGYCGYAEPETEDRVEFFECFYDAVEGGYPAWIAYRIDDDWPGDAPDPLEVAMVYDGVSRVTSVARYRSCHSFDHAGPCVMGLTCESTGNVDRRPEEQAGPHGTGRINIEHDSCTEHEVLCP